VISNDGSNTIVFWLALKKFPRDGWLPDHEAFRSRIDCDTPIIDILCAETGDRALFSTMEAVYLWTTSGAQVAHISYPDATTRLGGGFSILRKSIM
jgi:hypothetical protein